MGTLKVFLCTVMAFYFISWIKTTHGDTSEDCPLDCEYLLEIGVTTSGVYTVNPDNPFQVYCDMETEGGGWTVFQRRKDGSVDFYRNFTDYEEGFGDLNGEFWLGLDKIYCLTQGRDYYTLRVDLEDFDRETRYANYDRFILGDATLDYPITLEGYSGDAGDSMTPLGDYGNVNGMKFSTKDRENDLRIDQCAVTFKGAWWYNACHRSNLNSQYLGGPHSSLADGINWYSWRGYYYSLKFTEMKFRKKVI